MLLLDTCDELVDFGPVGDCPCDLDDGVEGLVLLGVFE